LLSRNNNYSNNFNDGKEKLNPPKRLVFHFTKENTAKLKFKPNSEAGTNNISSLQAIFTHVWRSIIRQKTIEMEIFVYLRV